MRNTRLATAIHEAGHAVAQLATPPAPWIDSIELFEPGGDLLGIVNTKAMWQPFIASSTMSPDGRDLYRALAWKDSLFYLAGPIAELRWRRHGRAAIWLNADQFAAQCLGDLAPDPDADLGRVRARLRWAHPGEEQAAFVRAWLETEELIARHWREVLTIGRLLCQQGRLSDVELLEVWRSCRSS